MSKVIAVDFDGVIYPGEYLAETALPMGPQVGALAFVEELRSNGYQVVIHSARADGDEGREAIQAWLLLHGFGSPYVTARKPRGAKVYLDDRALRFEGRWPSIGEIEDAARPWNARRDA